MTRQILIILVAVALSGPHPARAAPEAALFAGPYIVGTSVYSPRDFASEIAPHVGERTSPAMLDELRSAIRGRYVKDGYVTPIVSIPAEDVGATNPRFIVHEARIGAFELRGDAGPYKSYIEQLAIQLQKSAPLRKEALKLALARISQLPGITSKPLFDPRPDSTNEFLLVLRVHYQPVAARIELNNGGTKGLGRELLSADVATNDALGLREQMNFTAAISSHPDRYQYEDARIQRSFGSTNVFADVSGSVAVPDPDVRFRDVHFSTGAARQWQLSTKNEFSVGATFNGDQGSIRNAAANTVIQDHERNVAVAITFARTDDAHFGRLSLGAQQGLDVAGSVVDEGDYSQVDARYTKYLLDAEKIIPLGSKWSLQVNLNGQVTSEVLPLLDRFTFGGIGFGAAFDPGSLSGDSGAEISAQLARVVHIDRWGMQFARFYLRSDTAVVWNNSAYFYHRQEASSAGLGAFARWAHVLSTLEVSTPVDAPSDVAAQAIRTFCSVAYVF
ncbi:MAG TPA: ShlB/FhaC/HecB family hemolysin secretion/activation protein [Steroidobacteraceae bacterium]|jgi:hemolysin activation/secretion protein